MNKRELYKALEHVESAKKRLLEHEYLDNDYDAKFVNAVVSRDLDTAIEALEYLQEFAS